MDANCAAAEAHQTPLTGGKLIKYLLLRSPWTRVHTPLSAMRVCAHLPGVPGRSGSADKKRGDSMDLAEAPSRSAEDERGAAEAGRKRDFMQ